MIGKKTIVRVVRSVLPDIVDNILESKDLDKRIERSVKKHLKKCSQK